MSRQPGSLGTCNPELNPLVASRAEPFTPRRAVDSSGRLGLFYDACCDQVLQHSSLNFVTQSAKSQCQPNCYITSHNPQESTNLLEWYNMHYELRLSVALHTVRETGVGGLINYSRPINKYTRFICCDCYNRTDYLPDDEFKRLSRNKPSIPDTLATHVIVLVNWGIDAVAVLQLSSDDELAHRIDGVLKKLCISLTNDQTSLTWSENEKHLLETIVHTEVFANIPDLYKTKSINDFYRMIFRIKNDADLLRPYNYNLYPIQYFYTVNNSSKNKFVGLTKKDLETVELCLLQLSNKIKRLRTAMDQNYPNLQQHVKNLFAELHVKWPSLEHMYMGEIERLRDLIVGVRRGIIEYKRIYEALYDDKMRDLDKSIEDFDFDLNRMQEKEHLIGDLLKKQFGYRDAIEFHVKNGDDKHTIEQKLFGENKYDRVIGFNDSLRKEKKSKWNEFIIENSQLRCMFVDFSYCSYEPKDYIDLRKPLENNNTAATKPLETPPLSQRPKGDDTLNILLLGESGVGKSTFINAFANYLTFKKLEQAEKKPVVLIPVSFIMTSGDDFKECQVTFNKEDDLSNEDHEHSGQSVTQHCRSYIFTLNNNDTDRKLRIIDTPGIGDVRGLAQDDTNMQHILLYTSHLTHLDAVCILMKPNNSRLNIFFRSCFIQLFDLFGENVRDKIIFCFTNARATFYTPGNTGPLLKELLKSLPIEGIQFAKANTFCFDSESFRYLVAIRNKITFTDSEEKDYKDSWEKSSNESNRFLEYICTNSSPPLLPSECESTKDAQLKITVMIRPMLEAMRNILRNIILSNMESPSMSIELRSRKIETFVAICLTCVRPPVEYGDFWITPDSLHVLHNNCQTCVCSPNEHYSIDYRLEYRSCNRPDSNSSKDLGETLDELCLTSAVFSYFLMGTTDISQKDLFLAGFERMIKEEGDICSNKVPCQLNSDLLKRLEDLKRKYEDIKRDVLAEAERIQLSKIYGRIQQMSNYPAIKRQMTAANEWHKFMIKQYEVEVAR